MIGKYIIEYCKDFTKIENYSKAVLDTTQMWECHHRLETHYLKDGKWIERNEALSVEKLKQENLYFDRPAEELIFMTPAEHKSLHSKHKIFSDETKKKISETLTGITFTEKRKKNISDKTKEAMSKLPENWRTEEAKENAKNARRVASLEYKEYKKNGGKLKWNEWNHTRKQDKAADSN